MQSVVLVPHSQAHYCLTMSWVWQVSTTNTTPQIPHHQLHWLSIWDHCSHTHTTIYFLCCRLLCCVTPREISPFAPAFFFQCALQWHHCALHCHSCICFSLLVTLLVVVAINLPPTQMHSQIPKPKTVTPSNSQILLLQSLAINNNQQPTSFHE